MCSLMEVRLGKRAAGFNDTNRKKQYQQTIPNGFQRPVNIQHNLPDPAALESGGVLGEQCPDFSQFVIPCSQGRI